MKRQILISLSIVGLAGTVAACGGEARGPEATAQALVDTRVLPAALGIASVREIHRGEKPAGDKDKTTANDGVKTALIKEKSNGGIAKVIGKGLNVPSPTLPVTAPLVVQLVNGETGLCWDAVFSVGDIKKNEAGEIKATVKNN